MSTILPFEIVLLVLPNLKGQNADLQSCALVCEQWRRESQAYLFHTVTLTAVDQYQRLRNLVVQSSRISSFIRDISFNLGTFDEHTLDAMTTLLRFLKLESLSLGVCSQDDPHVRDLPPILSETMTVSLGHAVTSFTLQSISLSRIDLQNLFSRASSLRHLSLLKVTCTSHAEAEAFDDGGACTMIEELVMEVEDSNLLEWFCQEHCSVKLASLRSLTLVYDLEEDKHDLINEMLKRTGTALEDLHLKRSDERVLKDGIDLNLTANHNLRSLHLNLTPDTRYIASRCPPRWVLSTLERILSPVPIQRLVLKIGIVDSLSYKRADYSRWRNMASLLPRKLFPSLQCVRIVTTDPVVNLPLVQDLAMQAIHQFQVPWVLELRSQT